MRAVVPAVITRMITAMVFSQNYRVDWITPVKRKRTSEKKVKPKVSKREQ